MYILDGLLSNKSDALDIDDIYDGRNQWVGQKDSKVGPGYHFGAEEGFVDPGLGQTHATGRRGGSGAAVGETERLDDTRGIFG